MTTSITLTFPTEVRDGERRVYFDEAQMRQQIKALRVEGKTFIQGSDSIYCLNTQVRYIRKESVIAWIDLKGDAILATPGEIARIELEREFGERPRYAKKQYMGLLDCLVPPNYWDMVIYENVPLYYVDLTSAYFQIYRYLSLDLAHPRGMGSLLLHNIASRLERVKPARNAIIGISRQKSIWMTKGGVTAEKPYSNPYLSPPLWHTVQAILHEIAATAIRTGCVYVATDGYIFTSEIDFLDFIAFLDDNDFVYHTEQGIGYLTGKSSYSVGNKTTKVKNYGAVLRSYDFVDRDQRGYVEWMKKVRKRNPCPSTTGGQ